MRVAAICLALALAATFSAGANDPPSPPVCIRSIDIDHTKTPNDHIILFFMKDGNVWSATLQSECPELRFNGFEYGPTSPDSICANMQTIHVLKSGAVCQVGALVPASR